MRGLHKLFGKLFLIVFFITLILKSTVVLAAGVSSVLTNRTELTELNLNDTVIRLTLTQAQYKSPTSTAYFDIVNEPTGTTINSVTWISNTVVDLKISYTGLDFDADISNFYVKAFKEGIVNGTADLVTSNMVIKSAIERITQTLYPDPLTETNLNGSTVILTLENDTLISTLNSGCFSLRNPGIGVISISQVTRLSDTQVRLTLAYDGLDFDANQSDFRIKLLKTALVRTNSDLETANIPIFSVIEELRITASNPDPIDELSLNGAVLTLTLIGDTFIPGINASYFQLFNPVSGLSIARIDSITSSQVNLILSFNGTDFDSNKTNFAIKLNAAGLSRTTTNLQTSNMTIYAVVEGTPSITISSSPYQLFELSLNGSTVNLLLREDSFKTALYPSYFQLNNAPVGVSIYKVTFINTQSVQLSLSFDNTDFDIDAANFSITVLPSALASGSTLISNTLTIKANKEVEGQDQYIITGESYPSKIQIAGYNVRNKKIYINIGLLTTKTLQSNQTALYEYFVEVFDNAGNIIGNIGSLEQPIKLVGFNNVNINNLELTLKSVLPNEYRVVVTVSRVTPL